MREIGTLYVCSTPIGNLEDASYRLVRILSEADLIACEDTRHTQKLLNHFGIKKKMVSYHEHNRVGRGAQLLQALEEGKNIALVSDAGTPGISDPGFDLVQEARSQGIKVEAVPGPSAVVTALSVAGLDTERFVFEGFLPSKREARRQRLNGLKQEERTIALYEAPHRLLALLTDIEEVMGADRQLAVARELTKIHEEVLRGTAAELRGHFADIQPRGEITVLIAGLIAVPAVKEPAEIAEEVRELIEAGMQKKEALKKKALEYNVKKAELYKYLTND